MDKHLTPAEIAEFLQYGKCARYAKHRILDIDETKQHSGGDFREAFNPLNNLLMAVGGEFEDGITAEAAQHSREAHDLETARDASFSDDHELLLDKIQTALVADSTWKSDPIMIVQPSLSGQINDQNISGDADIIFIWSTATGAEIRVLDIKRTNEERVYHQIQTAAYTALIRQLLSESNIPIDVEAVSAGVITQETAVIPLTRKNLPTFDVEPRIADLTRLLSENSELMSALDSEIALEDVLFRLDSNCNTCPYNEACVTESFEDGHIRLLGLTEAQQDKLLEHGVTTIADLADLCRTPKEDDWSPMNYTDASFKSDTYKELARTKNIGELLPQLVFRAQGMLDALQANQDDVSDRPQNWLPGTGTCSLPDDEPGEQSPEDPEWMNGSMVRVYLNVQHDHLRDRLIQISARVTATASDTEPQRISICSEGAPDDDTEAKRTEANLLECFWDEACSSIRQVSDGIEFSDSSQEQPLLHFYVYSESEHEVLFDAFDRYPHNPSIGAFRDTLEPDGRNDDGMISTLESEIESHIILETPSSGLVHTYEELQPPSDCYSKSRKQDDWTYSPPDSNNSYDLRRVFGRRLFYIGLAAEYQTAQKTDSGGGNSTTNSGAQSQNVNVTDLRIDPSTPDPVDGINTRMRHGANIPLAYLWAALGRIDEDWKEKDSIESLALDEFKLQSYRYRDAHKQNELIRTADIEALGRNLCDVLEHIERSLIFKDALYTKTPFPIDTLEEDTFEPPSLAQGAKEYLKEEYRADREEKHALYRKFPIQRMLTGQSIPVRVTEVEVVNRRTIRVRAKLKYDDTELFGDAADKIKRECRKKGSQGTSSGSWMVANPFSPGSLQSRVKRPYKIEQGANATIEELEMDSDGGRIEFTLTNFFGDGGRFGQPHARWTMDADRGKEDYRLYVDAGEWLILDPQTDDITAKRAQQALEHADSNALHQKLEAIRHGEVHRPETPYFNTIPASNRSKPPHEELVQWIRETYGEDTYPSQEQRSSISEVERQIVALQGPPGTGKTAATMAPALLTRLYAGAHNGVSVNGLVTAPSNTAINELLEETAGLLGAMAEDSPLAESELDIELVRIGERPQEPLNSVTYVDYNNEDHEGRIKRICRRLRSKTGRTEELKASIGEQVQLPADATDQARVTELDNTEIFAGDQNAGGPTDEPLTLVFATTTRCWRFLKEVSGAQNPGDKQIASQELWHLLAVDEASMLELPNFILAGSALQQNGQVLVGGDQRQLPPVQKHDWGEVRRRDIRSTAAYLSTLDYLRLLRGDSVLTDDQEEWFVTERNPSEVDIPLIQLKTTYRFGPWTAQFVKDTVYEQDGITYRSGRQQLNPIEPETNDLADPLKPLFDTESTVTLITYGADGASKKYQQANPIESALTEAISMITAPDFDIGVVTPHNAQRGQVQSLLEKRGFAVNEANGTEDANSGQDIQVETVNRFQGGERNLMIVNATVSDPNYIAAEDEFLLEENRINVAFTRHSEQLIVLAPNSLLGYLPQDPELYESARLWKDLAVRLGESPTTKPSPDWQGELGEFLAAAGIQSPVPERIRNELRTTIAVYMNSVDGE